MMMRYGKIGLTALVSALFVAYAVAQQQNTAFTFQGFLKQNGEPVNDQRTFIFNLYDAPTGGNLRGSVVKPDTRVSNGHFSVELNFDSQIWDGNPYYLEVRVVHGNSDETLP